jgi:hypothetical protein
MQLFYPPCCWCCHPCSLCSQLLYRSFTASWLLCCLLCSHHNEGTVVLTMWVRRDYVTMNVTQCFIFSCVLGKWLNARHVSIFSGPKWWLTIQGVQKFHNFAKLKLVETPQSLYHWNPLFMRFLNILE